VGQFDRIAYFNRCGTLAEIDPLPEYSFSCLGVPDIVA
jgi:hypothetical protein